MIENSASIARLGEFIFIFTKFHGSQVKNVRADISESAYDYMQLLNILQFPKKNRKGDRYCTGASRHVGMESLDDNGKKVQASKS